MKRGSDSTGNGATRFRLLAKTAHEDRSLRALAFTRTARRGRSRRPTIDFHQPSILLKDRCFFTFLVLAFLL